MKRFIMAASILLGAALSTVVKADFYAYKEWVNPKTGQVIEEYFDLHVSKDEKTTAKQKADFIADAKRYGKDCLCLIEDMSSRFPNLYQLSKLMEKTDWYKEKKKKLEATHQRIKQAMQSTPIRGLYTSCIRRGVPAINIECRNEQEIFTNQDIEKELMFYNDSPSLNEYYKSLMGCADVLAKDNALQQRINMMMQLQGLLPTPPDKKIDVGPFSFSVKVDKAKLLALLKTGFDKASTRFVRGAFLVDAQILHMIHNHPTIKRFKIAAGGMHIEAINFMLAKEGWIPTKTVVSPELTAYMKTNSAIKTAIDTKMNSHKAINTASSIKDVLTAIVGAWNHWLSVSMGIDNYNGTVVSYALDIAKLSDGGYIASLSPSSSSPKVVMEKPILAKL
jgi:hypothetical protein